MADKATHVATGELHRVAGLTRDAAVSRAYLYPLKGIAYLATHRPLWHPMLSRLAPTLTMAAGVVTSMFFFTYLPQVAVLAFAEGPLAPISAIPLVLSESSTLLNVLSRTFLIEDALVDTFDGTLVARGCEDVVSGGREVRPGRDPVGKLGKLIKKPFARFTPTAILRYLVYLPLNFIPVVGTALFIVLQGKRTGPSAHARYFQLKGMSGMERDRWVEDRRGAYTSFGVVANLLELVPIAGIFFAFTNQVAGALWAADIERQRTATGEGQADKNH